MVTGAQSAHSGFCQASSATTLAGQARTDPRWLFNQEVEAIRRNRPGVLALDPQAIHEFRISVRKLRALLEVYRPLLPRAWSKHQGQELRLLGRSLGELRDSDVLEQRLVDAAAELDESLSKALKPLFDMLAKRRREQSQKAAGLLNAARFEALVENLSGAKLESALTSREHAAASDLIEPLLKVRSARFINSAASRRLAIFIVYASESGVCAMRWRCAMAEVDAQRR